jgi:hypothetical protein
METLPEIQARQKLTVEMTANAGGIDAFFTSLHVEKKRFWKAGWYHPLNKFLQDPSPTSPTSTERLQRGRAAGVTQPDGSISAGRVHRRQRSSFRLISSPRRISRRPRRSPSWSSSSQLHAPPGTYGTSCGLKNANATQYPSILFRWAGRI